MGRKTAKQGGASIPAPSGDWGTAKGRVSWLVETWYKGNRSAFASAIGVSHTAVIKVVSGDREPGRKLLAAIARELAVNPTWLLTGQGQPGVGPSGLPVSQQLLPGPPLEHQSLLSGRWVDLPGHHFTPSHFLLELDSTQPILREPERGFRVGDQLLMQTERTRFPWERGLDEHLCIVRLSGKEPPLRLAAVTSYEPDDPESEAEVGYLEVDTFDLQPDKPNIVREEAYLHYPDGKIRHRQRQLKLIKPKDSTQTVPVSEGHLAPAVFKIQDVDIVAVWDQILRRPRVYLFD